VYRDDPERNPMPSDTAVGTDDPTAFTCVPADIQSRFTTGSAPACPPSWHSSFRSCGDFLKALRLASARGARTSPKGSGNG
jgi:hypothetical protein